MNGKLIQSKSTFEESQLFCPTCESFVGYQKTRLILDV